MSFETDKAALLDLVKQTRCEDLKVLEPATDYPELFAAMFLDMGIYDCDPAFLVEMLELFDDTDLTDNAIYLNKTDVTAYHPLAVVNSTYDFVAMDPDAFRETFIYGTSVIGTINVTAGAGRTDIALVIAGGATVAKLDVAPGSCVDTLLVKACAPHISTLDKIIEGSCVSDLGVDADAIFNGYTCEPEPILP